MRSFRDITIAIWLFYFGIVIVGTSAVWGVTYFVNQDGSAHAQSAYLQSEILRGNPVISETYVLNSVSIPNSSVHIVLLLLLQIVSAFTATKIVVVGLFAGMVAAVGWLRFATVGIDGLKTSLLIGAVIAFNWLWLVGNYNFMLSVIVLAFTLGIYWSWREHLNAGRALALLLLFAASYFSHIMGFAILAGSVVLLAIYQERRVGYRALVWTLVCLVPFVPLVIWYRSISDDGSPASPIWRSLADPLSLADWITQIRSADPFVLISRTAFPFVETRSPLFGIFTPSFWMIAAIAVLGIVTIRRRSFSSYLKNAYVPFAALFLISAVLAVFAPDDFGLTRGGLIRERIVICGLVLLVPLFRTRNSLVLKRAAQIIFGFVIIFQIAALWDYATRGNRTAREYISAKKAITDLRSIATVTVYSEKPVFHSTPEPQLNLYNSIGNNLLAWDNYEEAHFLFPVKMRSTADRDFALQLTKSNVFYADDAPAVFAERLAELGAVLANDGGRIDAMLVWGKSREVDAVLSKYFDSTPVYQSENLRLFRRIK